MGAMDRAHSMSWVLVALALIAGCEEKAAAPTPDASPPAPVAAAVDAAPAAAPATSASTAATTGPADAGRDAAAEARRFDPKYTCPTGQTHFYLEGDFCRKKCFSKSDCGPRERCSAMDYPFLVDGKPGGNGHFCEM
jgi:hypothetical protein